MAIGADGYNRGEPTLLQCEIEIGVSTPFTVLHMSDTHLTLVDERDNERKHELAEKRGQYFPESEATLELASARAGELGAPILHTGDLIDFVSHGNLARAERFVSENDVFHAAGNHEFSQYVGEAFEDEAYRNQSLPLVQAVFRNDIRFSCREICGVNFVAIDNSYYHIERAQLDALKAVVSEGKPIVLMMHTPLYTPALFEKSGKGGKRAAYLLSVPEERMAYYEEKRVIQQKADALTVEATRYIEEEPAIRCLLAGHLHFCYNDTVADRLPQYVTGTGVVREIVFS